ncbi:DUF6290 family protein [Brachyspira innocens]|uniref:DUF6290 family protein n=1 Tax=Brachyspira innocens TaxID=13264 RepID=A0ABT8YVL8_9SPIR|nr:DUF6290 family protein [Brachyspira innocens]MDO6992909.1 DUF6290 family protein [Brachyspira innocens]MDO7019174.1 DUF6290 family protein [Brachyspira innocens]
MSEEKNTAKSTGTWGGARAGAGRKKKEGKDKTYVIFFRINEEENNLLKKYAEENNLSVGLFSKKAVLKTIGLDNDIQQ